MLDITLVKPSMIDVLSFVTAAQKGSYDHIIVNDDLDVAYEKLKGILIKVRATALSALHSIVFLSRSFIIWTCGKQVCFSRTKFRYKALKNEYHS